jgi:Cd2+/Zn2+-exporting ATPase
VSGILLACAIIDQPSGLVGGDPDAAKTPLYFASALVGSLYIWWSAIQGIRQGDFTADIPVSLATAAALAIEAYSAAAVVAVLLLLGGMLENFVAARAGKAVEALAALLPDRVTVRREGRDETVPLGEVRVGDLVLVRSGERIPVDGRIRVGVASINEAPITGESMLREKGAGEIVYAGSLSELGAFELEATRVGDDTALAQIHRMIVDARKEKAPVERLLDRYAKLYTPVAIALGAILWWWSGDALRAITMLIVFCPCVMVLATPTALVASIGNAALRGSLVKKGATIEALAKIDTIMFDKTGTLTTGHPVVSDVVSLNGLPPDEILRLIATAERFSEHPIGRAIVDAALSRGLQLEDPDEFEVLPGLGVVAKIGGERVTVGRPGVVGSDAASTPERMRELKRVSAGERESRTMVEMTVAGKPAGLVFVEDGVRPEAEETVNRLRAMGVKIILASGDHAPVVERLAERLEIDVAYAEVLPGGKAEIVRQLRAEGRHVAFVGDGINDGPALASADVGVAMGLTGTDLAIEAADTALLSDDLSKLPHLLRVSRMAVKAIRQNLAFSLFVLAIAVGFTIPGILTPVSGALLHELSSIPVIANSARLIGVKHERGGEPLEGEAEASSPELIVAGDKNSVR